MDFTSLCLDIQNWLNRDDLEEVIPTFVAFGQNFLEDELRIPAMEYTPSDTPYLGKGAKEIAVPSDYVELKYIAFTDQIPSPVNVAFTAGAGTLAAGTYSYRISATNANGETLPSAETSITLGVQGGVNVNWSKVDGATGYKIYGRTSGAEKLIATVGDVSTYLDSGAVNPAGDMSLENTTGTVRYRELERWVNKKFTDNVSNISKSYTGRPEIISRVENKFIFDKYADQNYVYEWMYYRRLTKLSESNPTNWWTDNASEALLYASLYSAAPFLGDDPRAPVWEKARDLALEKVRRNALREESSGQRVAWRSRNVFFKR